MKMNVFAYVKDPVSLVQASGIRSPEGPINNHSPTRDSVAAQSASLVDWSIVG